MDAANWSTCGSVPVGCLGIESKPEGTRTDKLGQRSSELDKLANQLAVMRHIQMRHSSPECSKIELS